MSLKDHAAEMAELYATGYSQGEIAEKFGTSRQRVHQLIAGTYERPHWGRLRQERYDADIRAAHDRIWGDSTVEAEAERLGITPNSLKAALRLQGLTYPMPPPAPPHGTPHRYGQGCRCDECQEGRRAYRRKMKARGPRTHGTVSAYRNYGCRCDECRAAGSIANRLDRQKRKERKRQAVPLD